ncbi:MAG TPA: hypothetical protein VGM82_24115 [Gemmatimonadaceae bacterium]|jgi:hypothetical protein
MPEWLPHREPLSATLTRTIGIAVVAGGVVALATGHIARWPLFAVLMFWPSFGGHWIDLFFLNVVRSRLPSGRAVQQIARIAVWFVGGVVLLLGIQLTLRLLTQPPSQAWLTWVVAGGIFVAIEFVAHIGLSLRGKPSFYNGLG